LTELLALLVGAKNVTESVFGRSRGNLGGRRGKKGLGRVGEPKTISEDFVEDGGVGGFVLGLLNCLRGGSSGRSRRGTDSELGSSSSNGVYSESI
jgi:hypothetical protein